MTAAPEPNAQVTSLGPLSGLRCTGSGVAFPRDACPEAPQLDNQQVASFLARHGVVVEPDLDPLGRWGCQLRQWAQEPGSAHAFTNVAEMGVVAGRRALAAAGIEARQLDLILVATSTPDRITSSLAARVAKALSARCGAIDIRGGGAGGLLALLQAATMLTCGLSRVLVVASEAGAGLVDPRDIPGVHLYADGAGAVVVERCAAEGASFSGLVRGMTGVHAASGASFTVPGPLPVQLEALQAGAYRFSRPDSEYLAHLHDTWQATSRRLADTVDVATLKWFLPYPVTQGQVQTARSALGVEPGRVVANLADHGVLGGAGCLVSLHHVLQQPSVGRFAMSAVAGGIVWCTLVWEQL